jgi:hypothetical protein
MQDQITELEKNLYNKHLIVSRTTRNKPFKLKKDFSDIIKTEKHKFLKRLAIFIQKHPEVNLTLFFEAPYKLYPDVAYFGLDYFASLRAIKSYTMYKKILLLQDPDSQTEDVKKSLHFIAQFCVSNHIPFYSYHKHQISDLYTWMVHYKENKINLYAMMEFTDIYSLAMSLGEDVRGFFVQDFIDQFKNMHLSYIKSKKLKPFLQKSFDILNNFVDRELTNTKYKR